MPLIQKPAIAMKESKCSVSLCLITYQGNAEQENRCHSHRPRSPSEWDNKSCSCGCPHATFAPPDVQRRPAKYKKIFLHMHITLEFFQGGPGSYNNSKHKDIISNSSCIQLWGDVMYQSVQVSMHFLLQRTVMWGKFHKHIAFHPRNYGSITSTQWETHFVQ